MARWRELLSNLYDVDLRRQTKGIQALGTVLRFASELKTHFARDTLIVRASGMAYNTLLAIVPLVAVFFSVFAAFERFGAYKEQIQQWVFSQIVPTSTDEIVAYINQFTANTKALGMFSTLFLFLTAILLFDSIEKNFNAVWKVTSRRTFMQRFLTFTSVVLWGPILIALSFYATGRISAFLGRYEYLEIGLFSRFFMGLLPWVFSVFAFFLMYLVIPNTRVRKRSALLGGVIGGTIWEVAKIGFTHLTARSLTYSALYGSLAVIPVFLIWLYLTWIIVLLGLEISYVHHNFHALVLRRTFARPSAQEKLHLAARLFARIAQAFYLGQSPPTLNELEERFTIPSEFAEEIVGQLADANIVRATELANGEVGYVPGRSLSTLKVGDVVAAAYRDGEGVGGAETTDPLDAWVAELLAQGEQASKAQLDQETWLSLVQRPR
jgi:membrane protein